MGNSDSSSRSSQAGSAAGSNAGMVSSNSSVSSSPPQSASSSVASASGAPVTGGAAPPGAYRMPGQPRSQRFYVTIPRGVRPGQHFAVLVNGQQMMVRCPENNRPGDRLVVTAPRNQAQQYVVTVPANVRQGQQFRVMINNQEVMVTCPRGVRPGQRVTFQLPASTTGAAGGAAGAAPGAGGAAAGGAQGAGAGGAASPPQVAPNHQMFEVQVPEGVRPGQPFALIANGQRVMVTCPLNVRPGQKIRFQLPIQLSQQQLEAIRVNYDKDGWMRCLGPDLKFHWAYNKNTDSSKSNNVPGSPDGSGISYEVEQHAFIRDFHCDTEGNRVALKYIPASEYACDTTVRGMSINYSELTAVAAMPFNKKGDWLKSQFANIRIPWEEGHIKIKIRRASVLQDAMDAIESIDTQDMRKIFRFEFLGEPALDAGGVAREFYEILTQQLFNPDFGLFLYSAVNQICMQINPNSYLTNGEYHLKYFHMTGRILAKALMDGHITPVHLVQPIYKHLMGWPIYINDLEQLDDQVFRNLVDLLTYKPEDIESLMLDFVITEDKLGITETVELVPGGADLTVDSNNLASYLEAQCKYRTMKRIEKQLLELLKGFYDVIPEPLLSVFDFQELELLLHGLPNIDMDDWIRNTEYTGDFQSQGTSNKVVTWFWEVVRALEHEQKAKLLQFVTGTSGVPIQGFAYLQGNDGSVRRFTLHGDKNVKVFPRAHTCFNRIDMPIYKTKAELQKYLLMAISMESTGFGIE